MEEFKAQPILERKLVITRNGEKFNASINITVGFSETNKYAVNFRDQDGGFTNYFKNYIDACKRVDEIIKPEYIEVL